MSNLLKSVILETSAELEYDLITFILKGWEPIRRVESLENRGYQRDSKGERVKQKEKYH